MAPGELSALIGVVTDEEIVPLANAKVTVAPVGLSAFQMSGASDSLGSYRIDRVPAGAKLLTVIMEGYEPFEDRIDLPAGQEVERDIILVRLPGVAPRASPQAVIKGHFECAAEYGVGGGGCDNETRSRGQSVFNVSNEHPFEVAPRWGGVLFEIQWEIQGAQQAMEGIQMEITDANRSAVYGVAQGSESVVRISFEADAPHPSAIENATIPSMGGPLNLRVLPVGTRSGETCNVQCLHGAGVALELKYTIYPTFFFGSGVDPSYTAVQASP